MTDAPQRNVTATTPLRPSVSESISLVGLWGTVFCIWALPRVTLCVTAEEVKHLGWLISHGWSVPFISFKDRISAAFCYTFATRGGFNLFHWSTLSEILRLAFCVAALFSSRLPSIADRHLFVLLRLVYSENEHVHQLALKALVKHSHRWSGTQSRLRITVRRVRHTIIIGN